MEYVYRNLYNQIINVLFVKSKEDIMDIKEIAKKIIEKCGFGDNIETKIKNNLPFQLNQHPAFKKSFGDNTQDGMGLKYIGGEKEYEIKIIEKGSLEREKMEMYEILRRKKEELENDYNKTMEEAKRLFSIEYNKIKSDLELKEQLFNFQTQKWKEYIHQQTLIPQPHQQIPAQQPHQQHQQIPMQQSHQQISPQQSPQQHQLIPAQQEEEDYYDIFYENDRDESPIISNRKTVSFQEVEFDMTMDSLPPLISSNKLKLVRDGQGHVLENWVLFSFSLFFKGHKIRNTHKEFFEKLQQITKIDKTYLYCVLDNIDASQIEFYPFGSEYKTTKLTKLKKNEYFFVPAQILPLIALVLSFRAKRENHFFNTKIGNYLLKSLLFNPLSSVEAISQGESLFNRIIDDCTLFVSKNEKKNLKDSCLASNRFKGSYNHAFVNSFLKCLIKELPEVDDQVNFLKCFERAFPKAVKPFVGEKSAPILPEISSMKISFIQRFAHWVNIFNIQKKAISEGSSIIPECFFPSAEKVFSTINETYRVVRTFSDEKYQKSAEGKVVGLELQPSVAIKTGVFLSMIDGEIEKMKKIYWKWMYDGCDFFGRSLSLFSGQFVGYKNASLSYKNLVNIFLNFENEKDGSKWMETILKNFDEIKKIILPSGKEIEIEQVHCSDYKVINNNAFPEKEKNRSFCIWCQNAFTKCTSKQCKKKNPSDCVCRKVKSYLGSGCHLVMKFERTKGKIIAYPHQIVIECVHCGLRTLEKVISVSLCKASLLHKNNVAKYVEDVNDWLRTDVFNQTQSLKIVFSPNPSKKALITPSCFKIVKGSEESRMKLVANIPKFLERFMNQSIITNPTTFKDELIDTISLQVAFLKEGYTNHKRRHCYEIENIPSNKNFQASLSKLFDDVMKPLQCIISESDKSNLFSAYKCSFEFWANNLLVITNIYRHGIPGKQDPLGSSNDERIKQLLVRETNSSWSRWECANLDEQDKYDFTDYLIMILLVCIRFVNGKTLPGWYEHFLSHVVPLLRIYLNLLQFSSSNLEGQIKANKHNNKNTNNINRFDHQLCEPTPLSSIPAIERVFLKPLTDKLFSVYLDLSRLPDSIDHKNENENFKLNETNHKFKDIKHRLLDLQEYHLFLEKLFGNNAKQEREKVIPKTIYNTKKRKTQSQTNNFSADSQTNNSPTDSQTPQIERSYTKTRTILNSISIKIDDLSISLNDNKKIDEEEKDLVEDEFSNESFEDEDENIENGSEMEDDSDDSDNTNGDLEGVDQIHPLIEKNVEPIQHYDWINDELLKECKRQVKDALSKKDITCLKSFVLN